MAGGPYNAVIPLATVNAASKTTTPAIRTCFLGGGPGCNETSTVVAVLKGAAALPPFVV